MPFPERRSSSELKYSEVKEDSGGCYREGEGEMKRELILQGQGEER